MLFLISIYYNIIDGGLLMADFVEYTVNLGTFEGEDFVWKVIYKNNSFDKAYKFYHKYTNKQMSYTDEELKKIWQSGRVDVELKQGNKLLNWVGMYSRKVARDILGEEDDTVQEPKEKETKEEPKDK
jgi:putative methionine-R-sulfoxide reductase with GAF domain